MAATLAYGAEAVLSHRSAAVLHGLIQGDGARIDISLPRASARTRPGILIHRHESIPSADRTAVREVSCTSVPRTLLDLAGVVSRRQLERACDQAEVLRLLNMTAMDEVLSCTRGRRGVRNLRAVLNVGGVGDNVPRSVLEERFVSLCCRAGLPRPSVNAWVLLDGQFVAADFVWRGERVVVETDGYRTHGTRQAFGRDQRRDQLFASEGWTNARFTWDAVIHEAAHVARITRRAC